MGNKIIIVEAAVLLEAEWNSVVNEIWVSFIPDEEAIRPEKQRDTHKQIEKAWNLLKERTYIKDATISKI